MRNLLFQSPCFQVDDPDFLCKIDIGKEFSFVKLQFIEHVNWSPAFGFNCNCIFNLPGRRVQDINIVRSISDDQFCLVVYGCCGKAPSFQDLWRELEDLQKRKIISVVLVDES